MTWGELLKQGQERLKKAGIQEYELDAWYLFEQAFSMSRARYFLDAKEEAAPEAPALKAYENGLERRSGRVPLQHILGTQEFMGMEFFVNAHVLIPRQDTETLVETVLNEQKNRNISVLDMCTGSGCILISVLYYLKRSRLTGNGCRTEAHARGTGADISEKALAVAEENAARHHVEAQFVQGDLFANVGGRYGMILSNPPYIRTAEIERLQDEVRMHDPICALDGKEDGLYFYRRIVKESRTYLEKGGMLIFEIGYDQAREVTELMIQTGFSDVRVGKDLAGLDRVVYGRYDNEWKG